MSVRHLASPSSKSSSYLDAELPDAEDSFVFGANNSDLAQQLYYRSRAEDSAKNVTLTSLPAGIQGRLSSLNLEWKNLDGIAQRALLWDSGFVVTSSNAPVQVFTVTRSMADLSFSLDDFYAAGCTALNCTQPDGTTSYSNMYCNGAQMISAARCFVQDFEQPITYHAAMWSTGGLFNAIPMPRILKHEWSDESANTTYDVRSIHTLASTQEAAYGECPARTTNGGYSSLVIPCAPLASQSDMVLKPVEGSDWVSRWLVEDYSVATVVDTVGDNSEGASTDDGNSEGISTDGGNSEGISPALVVGVTIACITVVVVVVGALLARRRRFKATQGQTGLWNDDIITANRIPREKVRIDQLISRGAFGEVYTGIYNDQKVAVKMLLPSTRRDIKLVNAFLAEARLTATMEHPRVVSCIGIAWDSLSDLCVVLEFVEGGDLRTLLGNYEKSSHPIGFNREKVTIALHVAHALTYLHSLQPPVIHRDLKSRNILLNQMLEAKLTDFGISRERLDQTMTAGVGTSLWMAPEVMRGDKYDEKADMFSFGVVLSELDVHTLPYAQVKQEMQNSHGRHMTDATLLQRVAMGTVSVCFSNAGPQAMLELGQACVSMAPNLRPSAAEALCELQVILSKEMAREQS